MTSKAWVGTLVAVAVIGGTIAVVRAFALHLLPVAWTDEPQRLARLLAIQPGQHVGEIGAGNGAMAVEVVRSVGNSGRMYLTELDDASRRQIEARTKELKLGQVQVVAAARDRTNLPDACCDALYMRMVFHHIDRPVEYAREVARAVRPGGRVAVIDFPPGTLFFLGPRHGVAPEAVVRAFEGAGLVLVQRVDRWGGGTYLLLFSRSQDG